MLTFSLLVSAHIIPNLIMSIKPKFFKKKSYGMKLNLMLICVGKKWEKNKESTQSLLQSESAPLSEANEESTHYRESKTSF